MGEKYSIPNKLNNPTQLKTNTINVNVKNT